MLFASTLGSFVPTILKKMKLDPAIASGPLITVIVDLVGLLLLFQWGM
ncbi:MAG: magnesium transporter [Bdellovibrionota bacterium]